MQKYHFSFRLRGNSNRSGCSRCSCGDNNGSGVDTWTRNTLLYRRIVRKITAILTLAKEAKSCTEAFIVASAISVVCHTTFSLTLELTLLRCLVKLKINKIGTFEHNWRWHSVRIHAIRIVATITWIGNKSVWIACAVYLHAVGRKDTSLTKRSQWIIRKTDRTLVYASISRWTRAQEELSTVRRICKK